MTRSYASAVHQHSASMATAAPSPTIDINHPYFLSSSDHPGLALVTEVLTGENYHAWNRSIQIALSAKLKLGFIDGSLIKPATDVNQITLWTRSNDLVISWILNSINSEIRNSVVYMKTAKKIWDDLSARFSRTNIPRLFGLRKDLADLKQDTLSISAYFTKFRCLLEELDTLSPIPKDCVCDNVHKLDKYEQLVKLSQFLMGLNERYTNIRGHILLLSPLPDLAHAYSMLLQEENQRDFHTDSLSSEHTVMNVKFSPNNAGKPKSNRKVADPSLFCDHCNISGHTRDKCFVLHGYPEWHRLHGQPKPKLRSGTGKRPTVTANAVITPTAALESPPGLSHDQYQQLISLLQAQPKPQASLAPWIQDPHCAGISSATVFANTSQVTTSMHTWIIDSGATHHITPHLSLLHDVSVMQSDIHLPNGQISKICHSGNVTLPSGLQLNQVLHVPNFHCNLLSVAKLTADNSCSIYFSGSKCIMQDLLSKKEKEIGSYDGGPISITTLQFLQIHLLQIQFLSGTTGLVIPPLLLCNTWLVSQVLLVLHLICFIPVMSVT